MANKIITPYIDEQGEKFVHIHADKYNFLLDIKNLCKDQNWDDAMEMAKEHDRELPSLEMWSLIGAFRKEVNAVIEQLGGDILDDIYWSSSQCNGYIAWCFNATYGTLGINGKMLRYGVRGSLALSKNLIP